MEVKLTKTFKMLLEKPDLTITFRSKAMQAQEHTPVKIVRITNY